MILLAQISDVSVRIDDETFSAILVGFEMRNVIFILKGPMHGQGNVFIQVIHS